jgi:branched-subunit amino acid aminotransferase/4-amino-4-deoxychorismate lyase
VLRLRGRCDEAEREALAACEELRPYLRRELGWPLSELGRIRLRRGDLEGAEEAFLASTLREVMPVTAIEDHELAPGPIAADAARLLRERIEAELAEADS